MASRPRPITAYPLFAQAGHFDLMMLAGRDTLLEQRALDGFMATAAERGIGVLLAGVFNVPLAPGPRHIQLMARQRESQRAERRTVRRFTIADPGDTDEPWTAGRECASAAARPKKMGCRMTAATH